MKFAISTKNEVLKFGEVRSSSSLKSLFATQVGQLVGSGGELEPWMSIESYMDEENRALLAAGVPDVEALVASVEDYLSQALLLEADSAPLVAHE